MRARVPLLLALLTFEPGCAVDEAAPPLGIARQANVCAAGTTLEGVDVSTYDGDVDWAEVKAGQRAFGIAKATEGATFTDSQFSTNWPAMKSAGIVRAAYHFFHCDADPTTQATFFLSVLGTLEPGDLPPALDFEDTTTCAPSTGVSMAVEWLDAVASATGTLPLLYTSVNVLSAFDDTQALAGHAQLWVASRGVTCPDLPAPFTAWSFWQYSLTGSAEGLSQSNGMADLDRFNGDMNALLALTVGGAPDGGSSSSGSGTSTCTVNGVVGSCIDTSLCASMSGFTSTPGLCPGPATEQCCTEAGDAGAGGAGGSPSSSSSGGATGGAIASSASASSSSSSGSGSGGAQASSSPPGRSSGCAAPRTQPRTGLGEVALALMALAARRLRRGRRGRRRA